MEKDRIKILYVEDNVIDRMAVQRCIKRNDLSYDIEMAGTKKEAQKYFAKTKYDIVLLDYNLPDGSGIDLLKEIKNTPCVFVTGNGDEKVAVEAMKGGAYDYLIKDSSRGGLQLLPSTIEKVIHTFQLEQEKKQAEEQIKRQNRELEIMISELSVLYRISSVISGNIELNNLLSTVLEVITELDILKLEKRGILFLVEDDKMILACEKGQANDSFTKCHENMKVGDCLCGIAAKTGEVVISKNSDIDKRHTIKYKSICPHGHIILPLKTVKKVIGVLCLYIPVNSDINKQTMKILLSIANQLAIAIENSILYEKTKQLSLLDPLTSIANRRFLYEILEKNLALQQRNGSALTVIMADIDHFKEYNDNFGHSAGDMLLIDVTKIIIHEIREIDFVARYGGEEFFILLPNTTIQEAQKVAERIRTVVEEKTRVTMSLGISPSYPEMNKEELINRADDALYRAKKNGRNRTEISS